MQGIELEQKRKNAKSRGRPSVRRDDQEMTDVRRKYQPEYRAIEMWNRKLQSMLTILTAGEAVCKC